ncbi:MAG TPA: ribosome-binding factor A [Planctomycetota bacterium]|nr:ribosome-binding factor A [Planctomycetota bacterium]
MSFDKRTCGHRSERIQRCVFDALEYSILPAMEDPRLAALHVVHVNVTRNLASITVTLAPEAIVNPDDEVQAALDGAEAFVRAELAGYLTIKRMPSLRLKYLPLPLQTRGEAGGA